MTGKFRFTGGMMDNSTETTVPPAPAALEFFARALLCAGVAALVYAAWTLALPAASVWSARELRVLPRLSVFLLGLVGAACLQGGSSRSHLQTEMETVRAAVVRRGIPSVVRSCW